MESKICRAIGYVFHPIFIPFLGTILISFFTPNFTIFYQALVWNLIYTNFLITVFFPLLIIYQLYRLKFIKQLDPDTSKERIPHLIVATFFYFITYLYLSRMNGAFQPMDKWMLACSLSTIALTIISYFWKVSLHANGVGGLLFLVLFFHFRYRLDVVFLLALIIIITGAVAYSRLFSGDHNPPQIIAGFFLGIISVIVLWI